MIDDQWIKWYHEEIPKVDNRLGKTRTYGLFDGDRLIGIWSVEPKMMKTAKNELIKVGRCFAVGISADYRRMGLFVSLSKFALDNEREKKEFEYVLGFPQTGRSVIGGHLKAGWEEIKFVNIASVNPASVREEFSHRDVSFLIDFNNLNKQQIDNAICFDESLEYDNIRFLRHPKLQYWTYSYKDAYVILKPYSSFYHILKMEGDKSHLVRLIKAVQSIAKRHGVEEINVWNHEDFIYNDVLYECSFEQGARYGLPITIIAIKINANETLKIKHYNFGMGVEEGY